LTDIRDRSSNEFDLSRAKHQIEFVVGVANRVVGLVLTLGGLVLAIQWRLRFGGFGPLRAFYLYTAWGFGALELLASVGMLRRWPVRWILQLLPLVVPVIAYQYFILRFIFRRI
jgi:hypothetical protein